MSSKYKLATSGKYNALFLEHTCGKTKTGNSIVIVTGTGEKPIATLVSSGDAGIDRANAQLICDAVNAFQTSNQ